MLKYLWLTAVIVALDLLSKALVSEHFVLYETLVIIPGWFNLTLLHNSGAAFSFLAEQSGWQRWFFAIIALVISMVLLFWIKGLKAHERWMAVSLALVLGGALGNLWDRLTLGYVVDFLDFYYKTHHWPAFNIADMAISIGAFMLIIDALLHKQESKSE